MSTVVFESGESGVNDTRRGLGILFSIAGLALFAACSSAGAKASPPAKPQLADIRIFFKLDSRLSGPTYGGERWVSPPTFTTTQPPVSVRVEGVDAKGNTARISPKWTPADPAIIAVSPAEGTEVKISVKQAGESSLEVKAGDVSRKLSIKARALPGNALMVEITPQPAAVTKAAR